MYRHIKLIRQMCGGRRLHRLAMMALVTALTLGLMMALPPFLVGYSRHQAWKDSGLQEAAFFTRAFRFNWSGAGDASPPAYDELRAFLEEMPGCVPVGVNYCDALLEGEEETVSLFLYPEALNWAVKTPLSEGNLETAQTSPEALPVVLDSRLRGRYKIGDQFPLTYAEYYWYDFDRQVPAVVTGFLTPDNDHLSTLGGSNARRLKYFADKATGEDPLVMVAVEHPLMGDRPYTGDRDSIILLAEEGEDVEELIPIWREAIQPLNLGQIDSYSQILSGDTFGNILDNVDFFMLCVWLLALMVIGIFGESLMQTELWRRRLSVMGMIGMTPGKMVAYLTAGGYGSLFLVNLIGLGLGLFIATSIYEKVDVVMLPLILIVLGFTMLPGLLAFIIDAVRVLRMRPMENWNKRR